MGVIVAHQEIANPIPQSMTMEQMCDCSILNKKVAVPINCRWKYSHKVARNWQGIDQLLAKYGRTIGIYIYSAQFTQRQTYTLSQLPWKEASHYSI